MMNFFELSEDQIMNGLAAMHDSSIAEDMLLSLNPLHAFAIDRELQELAFLWISCDCDMERTKKAAMFNKLKST